MAEVKEGFEIRPGTDQALAIEWSVTSRGKDLQLIDRLTGGMLPGEFFSILNDERERQRGPILLALIATSLRARFPEWSVNRIERLVMDIDVEDDSHIVFLGADDDEATGEDGEEGDGEKLKIPPTSSSDDEEVTPESSETLKEPPASRSETPSESQP